MSNKLFKDEFKITIHSKKGLKVNKPVPWNVLFNILMSNAVYAAKRLDLKGSDLLSAAQTFCAAVDPETIFPAKEELKKELKEQEAKEYAMPTANPDYEAQIVSIKKHAKKNMGGETNE